MESFEFNPRTRVVFGEGALERLGELARDLGFRRTLLATDRGLVEAGHAEHATAILSKAGIEVFPFHDFHLNPTTDDVERGRQFAAEHKVDSIIGLGGGSSLDCAKGTNFLLTNGGAIGQYRGYGKASKPMLPMIGIPTTAGTGSEAQSYALISDAETHEKMACGDPKAAFRVALLDPALLVSQPEAVRAAASYDALSHAVETSVTTRRNAVSESFSREAWRLLEANYERVLERPDDLKTQGAMQLGAHFAGAAIENSMLGATHACANPLTARYDTTHGVAISLLLPTVVRWNQAAANGLVKGQYAELLTMAGRGAGAPDPGEALAKRLEELAAAGDLQRGLEAAGVKRADLPGLAEDAAQQWTGTFNPRKFDATGALEVYECAY